MRLIKSSFGVALALLFAMGGLAYEATAQELQTGAQVKTFARPGFPTVTVYVWGQADTGIWAVEEETDLLEFLSVVTRASITDRNPDRELNTFVRMYRADSREPVLSVEVTEVFKREINYPDIRDGDVIVIETVARRRFTWRDITRVVGTAASTVSLFLIVRDRL